MTKRLENGATLRGRHNPVTPAQRATMRELRAQGAKLTDIAALFGRTETGVHSHVSDIPCPWGNWQLVHDDAVDPLKILELRERGVDTALISERFGVGRDVLWARGAAARRNPDPYRIRRECQKIVKSALEKIENQYEDA